MKKLELGYMIISAILMMTLASSCKKDDSNNLSANSALSSGSWRVSYYYDKTKDETSDFNGYTFVFQQNGQLAITFSSGSANGTWSTSGSDDNGNSQKLILSAGATDPLQNLNDDWVITSVNASKIELKDDSNNNEILHFTKN